MSLLVHGHCFRRYEYFDENYMRRLNVLPGITGLLQINERNTIDFESGTNMILNT